MFRRPTKRIPQTNSSPRRQRRLSVEPLESRLMLSADGLAWGLAWAGASELTISFVPDGTDVAGRPSSLYAELQTPATRGWQEAIVNAFETWTPYASTNVAVVSDNGDPLGTPGPSIGDARFGDVRVAAIPLAADVIAMSVPQSELASGTWAGDIVINSQYDFANVDELFAVAVHEAGHVLGLRHSNNPNSPMFIHGIPDVTVPQAEDISLLRSVSGLTIGDTETTRTDDDSHSDDDEDVHDTDKKQDEEDDRDAEDRQEAEEARNANEDREEEREADEERESGADRGTDRDEDEDQDEEEKEEEREAFAARAASRIDAEQNEQAKEEYRSTRRREPAETRQWHFSDDGEGESKAEANDDADADEEEIVTILQRRSRTEGPSQEEVARQYSYSSTRLGNDRTGVATISADANRPFHYDATGFIRSGRDINTFRLRPSDVADGELETLTVTVRSTDPNGLIPRVEVLSEQGIALPTEVLANADGTLVVQIRGVDPAYGHLVRVMAASVSAPFQTGAYQMEAQFVSQPTMLDPLFTETLRAANPAIENSFRVAETTLAQLVLTVDAVAAMAPVAMWTIIYDAEGNLVQRIAAPGGETRSSGTLLLAPGDYRVEFHAARTDGGQLPEIQFTLSSKPISLPIGPTIQDPTQTPILPPTNSTPGPEYWNPNDLIVTDPIIFPTPARTSRPTTPTNVDRPWYDRAWWYWEQPALVILR